MTKWISRASVMRIIDADPVYSDVINEKTYMASQINNLPTKEEISRPHGEWIILPHSKSSMNAYKCSICGHVIYCSPSHLEIYKGCYCGADMRKESDPE